jgi:fibronectin-binding autotransporter adhesin
VVEVATTGNLRVEASVSGTGGITKTNDGFLTLVASNSYSGLTTLQRGFLEVQDNHGLGTTTGGTVLQNGTLRLVGVTVAGESLAASGGKLQALVASNAWTGPITLSGETTIEMPNAGQVLNLTGVLDGSGGFTKTGPGTVILSGTTANTRTGNTRVTEGELRLSKSSG